MCVRDTASGKEKRDNFFLYVKLLFTFIKFASNSFCVNQVNLLLTNYLRCINYIKHLIFFCQFFIQKDKQLSSSGTIKYPSISVSLLHKLLTIAEHICFLTHRFYLLRYIYCIVYHSVSDTSIFKGVTSLNKRDPGRIWTYLEAIPLHHQMINKWEEARCFSSASQQETTGI